MKKLLLPLVFLLIAAIMTACGGETGIPESNSENSVESESVFGATTETDSEWEQEVESVSDSTNETSDGNEESESKPALKPVDPIEDGGDYGFNK